MGSLEWGAVQDFLLAYACLLSAIEDHCLLYGLSNYCETASSLSDCPVVMRHIDLRTDYRDIPSFHLMRRRGKKVALGTRILP